MQRLLAEIENFDNTNHGAQIEALQAEMTRLIQLVDTGSVSRNEIIASIALLESQTE